ncbi:hypothetical protein BDV93DRAFT_514590 [Ceratobasidium sp. AG-I]|nr:hypothetical protein BDV93DRAFT_514590 [Ceratobasidium sp. AG-I]
MRRPSTNGMTRNKTVDACSGQTLDEYAVKGLSNTHEPSKIESDLAPGINILWCALYMMLLTVDKIARQLRMFYQSNIYFLETQNYSQLRQAGQAQLGEGAHTLQGKGKRRQVCGGYSGTQPWMARGGNARTNRAGMEGRLVGVVTRLRSRGKVLAVWGTGTCGSAPHATSTAGEGWCGSDTVHAVGKRGTCWDMTPTDALAEFIELGFPTVGNADCMTHLIHVTVTVSNTITDYLPDRAFLSLSCRLAVRLSTPLCSYEEAVYESDSVSAAGWGQWTQYSVGDRWYGQGAGSANVQQAWRGSVWM